MSREPALGSTRTRRPSRGREIVARLGAPLACVVLLTLLVDARVAVLSLPLALGVSWVKPARISRAAELGAYLVCVVTLILVVRLTGDPPGGVPTEIAIGALALTVVRAFLQPNAAPKGGDLALVVVAAAALGAPGHRFLTFAPAASVALAGAALARDPSYVRTTGRRAWVGASAFLALAVGVGALTSWALPRATYAVARRLTAYIYERPRSGFDESLGLGDARAILESDKLVLRVTGDEVDYLRGKVYQAFDGKQWYGLTSLTPLTAGAPGEHARRVHVESTERQAIYFAPLSFVVTDGQPRPDGVTRGQKRSKWDLLEHEGYAIAPPTAEDLQLPRSLRPELHDLARTWTEGASSDAEKLEAIATHLRQGYRYTLTRESFQGSAIRDFLFGHKAGHCELFATAFALVARAAGIPARIVGGYRVLERAPGGDGFLVRERHAHAWVEAYASTQSAAGPTWRTWDPTPPSAFLRRPSTLESALESAEELFGDLTKPRNLGILLGVVALGVVLFAVRRARAAKKAREATEGSPLHPELARLEAHLAIRGIERARAEGLFAFATRLEELGDASAADAVRACAALRYGNEGTLEGVRQKVSRCIAGAGERGEIGEPTATA